MSRTEEMYLRAATSSHLQANEYSDDIDSVIAGGSSGESLAACLLRLRGEYDAIRGATDLAQRNANEQEAAARNLEALALTEVAKSNRGPTRAGLYRAEAAKIRKAYESRAATDHKLIIVRLKSLPIARMALRNFVIQESGMGDSLEVDHLVRSVLQAFLVPRCVACGGRGFNGGHRQPTVHCNECRQLGRLTVLWGPLEEIGLRILYLVDLRCEAMLRHIAKRTRN